MNVSHGPAPTPEERDERVHKLNVRIRCDLWSAVWEASQLMSYDEIREFVERSIHDIEADSPDGS